MKIFMRRVFLMGGVCLCVGVVFLVLICFKNTKAYVVPTSVQIVEVFCGNDIKEPGESCDGSDLASSSCSSLGYAGGVLSCNANCTFNVLACIPVSPPITTGGGAPTFYPQSQDEQDVKKQAYGEKVAKLVDLNDDGSVSIADLSIMLYFYGKSGGQVARYDLDGDRKITLTDISILLYYWSKLL